MNIYNFFANLKAGTESLNYGRHHIVKWCANYIGKLTGNSCKILDIGAGVGTDLLNIISGAKKKVIPYAIESYMPNVKAARENGIEVFPIDIERESIPLGAASIDVVIMNQTVEHTKEIFWIFSEISRVLKPGGIAIIGVPNLASFHNRLLLLFGRQPSTIELFGPHVRGFTIPSFRNFITKNNYFEMIDKKGSNFYPFPPFISTVLSRLFPALSVGIFFLIRRTKVPGKYIDVLETNSFETPYFKG